MKEKPKIKDLLLTIPVQVHEHRREVALLRTLWRLLLDKKKPK